MGGGEALRLVKNVTSHGVEQRGVLPKELDVKDLLGVIQSQMCELGVQAGVLGAEIRDSQRGRDARTSQDNDVLGLLQQINGVVNGVPLGKLGPLRELPAHGKDKQVVVGLVGLSLEEVGRADAEGSEKLLRADDTSLDGTNNKCLWSQGAKLLAIGDGLFGCAPLGVWR